MNRSRYVTRHLDKIDREIIAALTEDGRISAKHLAEKIGLSSPSIGERVLKLRDASAIIGYTIVIDPGVFGLTVSAFLRIEAMPGELAKVVEMLRNTHQIVEAHRVTGTDGFVAQVLVHDVQELETVADRFIPFASTHTAIIQSATVPRRLPKL